MLVGRLPARNQHVLHTWRSVKATETLHKLPLLPLNCSYASSSSVPAAAHRAFFLLAATGKQQRTTSSSLNMYQIHSILIESYATCCMPAACKFVVAQPLMVIARQQLALMCSKRCW
jgi:hypothetical protein